MIWQILLILILILIVQLGIGGLLLVLFACLSEQRCDQDRYHSIQNAELYAIRTLLQDEFDVSDSSLDSIEFSDYSDLSDSSSSLPE